MAAVRILLTCSRLWTGWSTMRSALEQAHERYPDAVLVHGAAPKGDEQAAGMWREMGGAQERWPAAWSVEGRAAGYIRNRNMVESAPSLAIAFIRDRSKGASHCAQLAIDAGIPTVVYRQDAGEPELYNVDAAVSAP